MDENSKIRSKLKSDLPCELVEKLKENYDSSRFLWKKSCHVHSVIYDLIKQKNHLAQRNTLKFLNFYCEKFRPQVEKLENDMKNNPINIIQIKNSFNNLSALENEINKNQKQLELIEHNKRILFSQEKFKLESRLIYGILILK
jgi:hypothetical protein